MDPEIAAKIKKVADAMRARLFANRERDVRARHEHKHARAKDRQRKQAGYANAVEQSREIERKAAEFRDRKAAA